MKLSGSLIIIEILKEQGVDTVFGYPGGAIMPLYDALYDAPLRHVLTVHEQGAAHAADGYARASGRVGVCIATSGPGATNLVTGLATAYMDSSPVVAITGAGWNSPARSGRIPGNRYHRSDDADHQAQLSSPQRLGFGVHSPQRLFHRTRRKTWPGVG